MWRLVPPWQSDVDGQGVISSTGRVSARAWFDRGLHPPTVCKFISLKRPVSHVREEESCSQSSWWMMALPLAIIFSFLLVSIAVQDFTVIGTTSNAAQVQLNPTDQRVHIDLQPEASSAWDVVVTNLGRFFSARNFERLKPNRAGNQTRPVSKTIPLHSEDQVGDDLHDPSVQQSFSRSNAGLLSDLIAQANQGARKLKTREDLTTSRGQDQVPKFRKLTSLPNETCSNASRRTQELDGNHVCSKRFVHIAMTLDVNYLRGSMAAIYSILLHAECSSNIRFHFVATKGKEELEKVLAETLPFLQFQTYTFDESSVKSLISHAVRHALEEPLNYARFYLAHMIDPCVKRVIYLDSDVLVLDRIEELWITNMGNSTVGTPEYCNASFPSYFTEHFWTNASLASTFANKQPCYFNSGMMLINLDRWRKTKCTGILEYWMEVQKEQHIYELGSLPPLLLTFAGDIQAIDRRWNQHGLGGDAHKGDCRPTRNEPASLLHWSGGGKPWQRLDVNQPCPVDNIWAQYDLLEPRTLYFKGK